MKTAFLIMLATLILAFYHPLVKAAEKKPFEIADLYKLKSFSGLSLSRDGKSAVYAVTSSCLKKGKRYSDIYLLDLKSRQTRRLTFHPASDSHPFFSPDGKFIYFLSDRNEDSQLWRLSVQGGEAERISHFSAGISSPHVSPDGKYIYFSSHIFPECGADSDCHRKMAEKLEKGPTQGHMGKALLFRHWASYRDWKYTQLFKLDLESQKITALTTGKQDFPCYGGKFELSANGKLLYSKLQTGRHVTEGELLKVVRDHLK